MGKKSKADPTQLQPYKLGKQAKNGKSGKNGIIQVIIETPKGSRNKCAYDPEQGVFELKKVLPEGMVFPHDFGFVPSTRAEDGDPIDVLLLMDVPAFPGVLVRSRLIGVIEGEQTEDGDTVRNDRLVAVADKSHTHSDIEELHQLNETLLKEVQDFFVNYHQNEGSSYKLIGCKDAKSAAKLLTRSLRKKGRKK